MKNFTFFLILFNSFIFAQQPTLIKQTTPGSSKQAFWDNCVWKNKAYFGQSNKLSVTDGTTAGTIELVSLTGVVNAIIGAQDWLYVITRETVVIPSPLSITSVDRLYKCDGTIGNSTLLYTFNTNAINNQYFTRNNKNDSVIGNTFYFSANDPVNGVELWKTDGTVSGTTLVKDIKPGSGNGNVYGFNAIGSDVFFTATSVGFESKLWKTDGTESGTVQIPVAEPFYIVNYDVAKFGNKLIFYAHNTVDGYEPYISDGTAAGTFMLKNINPSGNSTLSQSQGLHFKVAGNYCYFIANDGISSGLWRTDGTTAGTIKLSDEINNISDYIYSTVDNEKLWYINYNSSGSGANSKLIVTDGSVAGTQVVHTALSYPQNLKAYKGSVWMQARDLGSTGNAEVWRSDGLLANTNLAFDVDPGFFSGNPYGFFELNNKLYFWSKYNSGNNTGLFEFNGDYTFNGSVSNNWGNKNNWNSNLLPISTDNVTIPSGKNVTIDTDAYAKDLMINSPINLSSSNLNISGTLDLGEKITLNNNNLNLKGDTSIISNGNATNYIVTNGTGTVNVENLNTARGNVHLPIGTTTNFNSITLSNSGTSDTFSAKVSDGISSTNPSVNTTWEISEAVSGGSNVNLTLAWNQSQENSGFDRNSSKVGHFVGGNWVQENSGTVSGTNPYTLSATEITSFSPFSVMNFGTLGTSDFSKSKVQVFPNPFNENLNISTQENGVVYFYDVSGKLVSTSLLMKGSNILQKSSLTKGIYFYQIKNKDGNILASGKVIKK